MFFDRRIILVCPYNGVSFRNKMEQMKIEHKNLYESQRYYDEWNKPVSKGFILYDFIYMTVLKRQKLQW